MTIPPQRLQLIRKLANVDQEISAGESWLAANRGDAPGADLALNNLRDLRQSAERIVILLRGRSQD